ncbi:ORF3 [Human adenovirus 7]|uniref:ORF3 n=8 Tax=Human mastadenovirus B TaxID=108098 RepID=I6LEV8_9ADEN|nr:11 kDa protein [Human adenovirus B3]AAW33422.1 13 kDa protein [Human adenovirus 7]AAZ30940.1 E4 ORF3 [Human mastadenovirus B]AET87170.1 ORF3 [Human adenovirus 66]AET87211.1 ORF3 [Human adenovirus 7d2]QFR07997.1 13 kDa protein [Human adenovirus sp.]QSF65126.1 E4 ORF3 [Human adenovirus 7d]WPS74345.1 control protein E4orf3 [Human adenovirus B, Type 114 (P114/H3/F3)]
MRVCLRMVVEGALRDLFVMCGLDLPQELTRIIEGWKAENYLGMVQECNMMFEELENAPSFGILLFLDVRVEALLEATVEHLENRISFDLAVLFHQHSGGDRCHLRDLQFEVLRDRLE